MMNNILSLFNRPLYDLGSEIEPIYSGIYSPLYKDEDINTFMSSHYEKLENAVKQSTYLDLTDYYHGLLIKALNFLDGRIAKNSNIKILDIGCGFGSSTLPLLKLFPNGEIIASELSSAMLYVLKEKLKENKSRESCSLLQLNAEDLDFKSESFDMVVGTAILHHLFKPWTVFEQMKNILKKGGVGIFFEPFENGMGILGLAYREIINHQYFSKLSIEIQNYFRHSLWVWQKMKNNDKTDPFFRGVDDKWMFSKHFFYDYAEKYKYDKCIIFKLNTSNTPFLSLAKTHSSGNNINDLPMWVFDIIYHYDEFFSEDVKNDFLTEGCIILVK